MPSSGVGTRSLLRRLPVGLRDVRLAIGIVVGMLLAGVVLPMASPERDTTAAVGLGAAGPGAEAGIPGYEGDAFGGTGTSDGPAGTTGARRGSTRDAGSVSSSAGGGSGGSAGPGAGAGPESRTASDRGVTADTIRIGVALADLDTLSRTGLAATNGTVAERRRVWEALVAHANEQGGAAGRTIELFVDAYDPLDQNAGPAACRRLAEDHQVFAIFADVGWSAPSVVCATRQYGLPNFGYDPQDIRTFAASEGLLWTSLPSNERMLYNEATILHERALLRGKTIGLVTREGFSAAHDGIQIPTLRSLGYELAHRSDLAQDLSTAQSQIPVEIQQMRSAGVDFIIWGGDPAQANIWLNQAQRSGYNPTYSFSDFSSGTDDFNVQSVGQQVDAYAWSTRRVINRRDPDAQKAESDEACTKRAEEGSGVRITYESDLYWNTIRYCSHLRAFADAADAVAPNPTRQSLAAAVSNLGQRHDLEVGPADVGGSWVPGKPDAPDYVHLVRHDLSCRCFRPEGEWFAMRPIGG